MTGHDPTDPVCPASEVPGSGCLCSWLSAARSDERERIAQAIDTMEPVEMAWVRRSEVMAILKTEPRIARRDGGCDE